MHTIRSCPEARAGAPISGVSAQLSIPTAWHSLVSVENLCPAILVQLSEPDRKNRRRIIELSQHPSAIASVVGT